MRNEKKQRIFYILGNAKVQNEKGEEQEIKFPYAYRAIYDVAGESSTEKLFVLYPGDKIVVYALLNIATGICQLLKEMDAYYAYVRMTKKDIPHQELWNTVQIINFTPDVLSKEVHEDHQAKTSGEKAPAEIAPHESAENKSPEPTKKARKEKNHKHIPYDGDQDKK